MAHVASPSSRITAWKVVAATLLPLLILGGFLLLLAQRPPPAAPELTGTTGAPPPVVLTTGESPLAVVNDTPLQAETLTGALAIDRAMGRLLGVTVSADPQAALERLVNGLLVEQAAAQANFALDESEVETALANFLTGAGQDEAALESALAAEGVTTADFGSAFAHLLRADRFTRQQAAAQGVESSDYLRSLQAQARISFGPDVAALTSVATKESLPAEIAAPAAVAAAVAVSEAAPPASPAPEWQLLPFVADPALAAAQSENAPVLTGSSSAGSVEQIVTGTATGNFAPDFSAALAKGEGTLTLADLKGKPTLLSFWTTWCPYCLRQTPLLVEAHSRWAGVNFAGVNVGEASAQVLPYLESHAIAYPIGLDESGEIAAAYAVRGFPTTYFLDAEGRVVARHVGQLSTEDIDSYLNQITQQ